MAALACDMQKDDALTNMEGISLPNHVGTRVIGESLTNYYTNAYLTSFGGLPNLLIF